MASVISDRFGPATALTITLASLANSAVGVGRQSTLVDNTTDKYRQALLYLNIMVGTTPTVGGQIFVYLIRQNNDATPIADDSAGTTDAGITINEATLLDTINVPAATSNVAYKKTIDTSALGALGPKWGIAVVNNSGVALNSTGGNHVCGFVGVNTDAT